jgi:hypothetical protein
MMDTEESAAIVQTHLSPIGGQMHLRMAVQRDMRAIGQSHVARHLLAIGENLLLRGGATGTGAAWRVNPSPSATTSVAASAAIAGILHTGRRAGASSRSSACCRMARIAGCSAT